MNASVPLQADPEQIGRFVDALFRYADEGGFVSLRAFYDDAQEVFGIEAHRLGTAPEQLAAAAAAFACRAARAHRPVVFAPPIATFSSEHSAREEDLQNGLAISVECDTAPARARARLEGLLGPATLVVASGGEWLNPETGELEPKLHLHWRLTEPTRDEATHRRLKTCRAMAKDLVGADGTSNPAVHPMRWPGSWHRKAAPRLARIVAEAEAELDLDDAEEWLREAWDAFRREKEPVGGAAFKAPSVGEPRDTAELISAITTGTDYHAPLTALAMRYLKAGMADAQVVLTLRGLMAAVPQERRDTKDGLLHSGRWQSRYDDIPRAVSTARREIDEAAKTGFEQGDIERFRLDRLTEGSPPAEQFLLKPYMPLGKLGTLFGPGGVGKSLTALALCLAVARAATAPAGTDGGTRILGGDVPPEAAGASIFLTLEDDRAELHRRAVALDPAGTRRGAPCFVIPAVDLPEFDPTLVAAEGRAAVLTGFASQGLDNLISKTASAAGRPVRLLVLDPAGDFLNGDENDATYVKLLMRHLRAVAARHGCTIILIGHVAKSIDAEGPTMRGSSAWIANSRFAFALWKPVADEAAKLARQLGLDPQALVWGNLVKANHAGAPIGGKRLFLRCSQTGRLLDVNGRLAPMAAEEHLLQLLVESCAEYAAAGIPFAYSGVAGLWNGRADLPEPLTTLSKARLEALGTKALERGALVKARSTHTQGAPKHLDVPDGPLAKGKEVPPFHGSRREALMRWREGKGG